MTARLWPRPRAWLFVALIAALIADPVVLTALADDGGDEFDGDDAGSEGGDWDDDADVFYEVDGDDDTDDDGDRRHDRRRDRQRQPQAPQLSAQDADDDDVDDDDDVCEIDDDDDADVETDGFCNDQAIVRLAAGADVGTVNAVFGTETIDRIDGRRLYLLRLPSGSDEPLFAANLEADSRVAWAKLNFVDQAPEGRPQRFFLRGDTVPIAGRPDQAYAPQLIGGIDACAEGNGATVAVIDSGLDTTHPAFAGTTIQGAWNAFTGQGGAGQVADAGNGQDDDGDGFVHEMTGHGTHVAGTVAQIAPGAAILPVKALDSDGIGQAFYLARALYYAVDQNADVVNLSLGSTADTRIVREATADAVNAGIFVAAAAGNAGGAEPREYPATLDDVFGVAATDQQDRPAEFTSTHASLDLSAPGVAIVSAFPAGEPRHSPLSSDYALWSGTSMATPWVAGAAALLMDQNPRWSASQVANRLRATAAPIAGPSGGIGSGRLDVGAALECGPDGGTVAKEKDQKKDKKTQKNKKDKKRGKNRR